MPTVRRTFSGTTGFRDVVNIKFCIYMRRLTESCAQKTKKGSLPERTAPAQSVAESEDRDLFSFFCFS
jgi:hypothetical protein